MKSLKKMTKEELHLLLQVVGQEIYKRTMEDNDDDYADKLVGLDMKGDV